MLLGINLEEVKPEGRTWPFADLMRQRGAYGTAARAYDGVAKLDDAGEPVGDFGVYVVEGADADPVPVPEGIYTVVYTGQAAKLAVSGAVIEDVTTNANGETTAKVRMGVNSLNFILWFTGVTKDIRNLRVFIPGHGPGDVYNRDLVGLLSAFACIRTMDFTRTNGNPQVRWSDRTPAGGRQSVATGAAWEHAVGLANAARTDLWLNVPHMADDDYVRNLAELVAAKLDQDLNVYVEYSNEVWNDQFPQCGWNRTQASAEMTAGRVDYEYPKNNNPGNGVYWGFRRTALRTAQIGSAFRRAFGAARAGRVRPVLGHQIMWYDQLPDQLAYLSAMVSEPKTVLYGAAVGSYLGPVSTQATDGATSSLQKMAAAFTANLPGIDKENQRVLQTCKKYGIENLAYELGTDDVATKWPVATKVALQGTDDMGSVVAGLLAESAKGLTLANYYLLSGMYGGSGDWGLSNRYPSFTDPKFMDQPKLRAALAFAKANTPVRQAEPDPIVSVTTTVTYRSGKTDVFTR